MNHNKYKKGYTIVEVLISSVIFTIIMLYAFGFFSYMEKGVEDKKYENYALKLCEDAIEHLKSVDLDYNEIPSTYTVISVFNNYNRSFTRIYGSNEVNTVSEVYKMVFSSVTYNTSGGITKTVIVRTIISPFSRF